MAKKTSKIKNNRATKPASGELIVSASGGDSFADHKVDNRNLTTKDLSEILYDGYINSLWEKRRGGSIVVDWVVDAGKDLDGKSTSVDETAVTLIRKILTDVNFNRLTLKMMSAIWYGYAVAQVVWEQQDNLYIPVDIKVHDIKHFRWDTQKKIWTYGNDIPLPDKRFWLFTAMSENDDIPYGRGLGLDIHLAWYLRKFGWKQWAVYLEKFGGPAIKGTFPTGAEQNDVDNFQASLQDLHQLGWISIPDGYTAEVMDGGAKGWKSNHELFMNKWDKTLPIIMLGQSMTTQDGSSQAQASVHKDVQDDIIQRDADLLCESFNNTVIKWIMELNFPMANAPRVYRRIVQEEDLTIRATREEIIARTSGVRPTKQHIIDTYGGEWEENPNTGQSVSPTTNFAESSNAIANAYGKRLPSAPRSGNKAELGEFAKQTGQRPSVYEDAITAITDDLGGDYEQSNPFAQFAEDLINKYDSLESLNNDWANIEQSLMTNPALLGFAEKLKNGINASVLNGALSTDREIS